MFRAAVLDEFGYVDNIIVVDNIGFLPNLVRADIPGDIGNIGDYWNGTMFISPDSPDFPPHP